jgi:hypothetical protein
VIALPALAVALVLTKGCHETSDSLAVGFAHCQRFGGWSSHDGFHLELALSAGAGWAQIVPDTTGTSLALHAGKTSTTINTFDPGALGGARLHLAELDLRADVMRWGPLRGGLAVRQGLAPLGSVTVSSPVGMLQVRNPDCTTLTAPLGADLRWSRVGISADIAPGWSSFSAAVTDSLTLGRDARFALLLNGSVRFWITPAVALEASGGVDLMTPDHLSMGLRLHVPMLSAFDGVDPVVG